MSKKKVVPKKKKQSGKKEDTVLDAVIKAIREVHGDMSVSREETLSRLESLRKEIDMNIAAIEEDIEYHKQAAELEEEE